MDENAKRREALDDIKDATKKMIEKSLKGDDMASEEPQRNCLT